MQDSDRNRQAEESEPNDRPEGEYNREERVRGGSPEDMRGAGEPDEEPEDTDEAGDDSDRNEGTE